MTTTKISDDFDVLVGFFNYPAAPWVHRWTAKLIESTFAAVRLR